MRRLQCVDFFCNLIFIIAMNKTPDCKIDKTMPQPKKIHTEKTEQTERVMLGNLSLTL